LASSHEQCACNSSSKQNSKIIKTKLDTVQEEKEEEEKENTHTHTRTHTPPEQREERKEVQSQLVIAEKGRHIALHTTTHNTLHAFLDSGANSHIFKTKDAFKTIEGPKTNLTTASGEKAIAGTVGKMKTFKTESGAAIDNQNAIFCDKVVENLISVGNMCDTQHTIVFTHTHSLIYTGEIKIEGVCVHKQKRDES